MIKSVKEFIKLRTSTHPDEYQRSALEEADISVWWEILGDHEELRGAVALNKMLPDEIVRALAQDKDPNVRYTIAKKRKCPPDVLANLAEDANDAVRKAVAMHKSTPKEVLVGMLNDEWESIVEVVKKRIS